MKTKLAICAAVLTAVSVAAHVNTAEAQSNYFPPGTTVTRMADFASTIVVGQLDRVENVQLEEAGPDAKQYPRIREGMLQDGEEYVRRDAVIRVMHVLKGEATPGQELSFVSMRQLRLNAYTEALRNGPTVFFLAERSSDGRLHVPSDERGTVSASDVDGNLSRVIDFIRDHLEQGQIDESSVTRLLGSIDNRGGRLSVDAAIELSWHHEEYRGSFNEEHGSMIQQLLNSSKPGSKERNELITAVGRYNPSGAFDTLMALMLEDASWSTTSLARYALNSIDRRRGIVELLEAWETAESLELKTVIVRALGQFRPRTDYDGHELRHQSLQLVNGLLKADTPRSLLLEALVASRDMRADRVHVAALRDLIDNRDTNGIDREVLRGALIALAAARTMVQTPEGVRWIVHEEEYLEKLADGDLILAQIIRPAIQMPWTSLIYLEDGIGR
jgi:hypothetical protein